MNSEAARQQLSRWGMDEATAKAAGLFDVDNVAKLYPEMRAGPAIMIPYYDGQGQLLRMRNGDPFCRVRRLEGDAEQQGFVKRKPVRYTQPRDMGPQVYFPQNSDIDWAALQANSDTTITITEGEAKAITACELGFQTIALGGVYNFTTPSGGLLPELDKFEWRGRKVYIVFDSDAATNPQVLTAEARLIEELQRKREAKCFVVRLPADGDKKVGLDDYLLAKGPDEYERLLESARTVGGLTLKIIAMNKRYAYISGEDAVWDLEDKALLQKSAFTTGGLSSTIKHLQPGQKGVKEIKVAEKWLVDEHAQRYSEILFRPSDGRIVEGKHSPALNIWDGWPAYSEGDITPFLRLNEFLFSKTAVAIRELPLKIMAYKAQNPAEKIPLGIVLIGKQGTGKTMWCDALAKAFYPYIAHPNPKSLAGEFEGWLEKTLVAFTHEMTPTDLKHCSEKLKALVADETRPMNEKFRLVREVRYYGLHVITSNHVGVGAFAADDRRMIVIGTPPPGPQQLYDDCLAWMRRGGARHLLHYLLNMDLKGWKPPPRAPVTAEKAMATAEAMTAVQAIAQDMQTADQHVIVRWLDSAALWAQSAELSANSTLQQRGRDIATHIKTFPVRPFYTGPELVMMLPMVVEQVMGSKFQVSTPAGAISGELRAAGIPFLPNLDNPLGFMHQGVRKQYLIVADFAEWEEGITQKQFDMHMKEWPTYGRFKKR
jgi:hypothetical protein